MCHKKMKLHDHVVLMKAMVGSHNYNLNIETSDKDYKYFVLPTFDELYRGIFFSRAKESDTEDYTVHDIRKLPHLFWKANVNFLEVLYGNPIFSNSSKELMVFLMKNRKDLCKMNLPYLYDACIGMAINYSHRFLKATPSSNESIEKYGYSIKCMYQAVRILDFLCRMKENDFDFYSSIWYEPGEERDMLMTIKQGKISFDAANTIYYQYYLERAKQLEGDFKSQEPNKKLLNDLNDVIKNFLWKQIKEGSIVP